MKKCSVCLEEGIDRKVYAKGFCSMHYQKYKLYGNPKLGKVYELHGMKGTQEYRCWQNMKDRCTNPKNQDYNYYIGKGIKVCDEWMNSFTSFYNYIGKKPNVKGRLSIDRIDPDGNYEPGNVRWADDTVQARNQGDYSNNTSGCKGVWWNKKNNNWRVGINVDGVRIYVGSFPKEKKEEAIKARKEAELKYWK